MRQVSKSQAAKNREVARIKKTKPDVCLVCGRPVKFAGLAHLFPKSVYCHYYTEPLNLWKMCDNCHRSYDDDKEFRSKQKHVIDIVQKFATPEEINRYFGV